MSMKHGLGSIGLWNIRRNSMSPTARSSSATSVATAESGSALTAKSKIPPQIGSALLQPGEGVGDLVDLFRFHVSRIHSDWQTLYSAVASPPCAAALPAAAFAHRR